jgi:hypothetical protein
MSYNLMPTEDPEKSTLEERRAALKKVVRNWLKKAHPDTNGNSETNNTFTRRLLKLDKMIDEAADKLKGQGK